jgi:hypothetical protein
MCSWSRGTSDRACRARSRKPGREGRAISVRPKARHAGRATKFAADGPRPSGRLARAIGGQPGPQ